MGRTSLDTLAARTKRAREQRGMTQGELAEAVGMKQPDISKIERGLIQKTTGIARIASALRVPVLWLEIGDGHEPDWRLGGGAPSTQGQESLIAQGMSVTPHRVPRTLTWEKIMSIGAELPEQFTASVPDDALMPGSPRGTMFVFETGVQATPGSAVIVKDMAGRLYMRRYAEGVGQWLAQATNSAYATLESERDGLAVLAVATWRSGGNA
jgi:transcriptional regulator with XRE-family HTH domain